MSAKYPLLSKLAKYVDMCSAKLLIATCLLALSFLFAGCNQISGSSGSAYVTSVGDGLSLDSIESFIYPLPLRGQEQSNWCWAACLQMLYAKEQLNKDQCEIASDILFPGRSRICCPKDTNCDQSKGINICNYGFCLNASSNKEEVLDWSKMKSAVKRGPILIRWIREHDSDVTHRVLARGYVEISKRVKLLIINNPGPVSSGDLNIYNYKDAFRLQQSYYFKQCLSNILVKRPNGQVEESKPCLCDSSEANIGFKDSKIAAEFWLKTIIAVSNNSSVRNSSLEGVRIPVNAKLDNPLPAEDPAIKLFSASHINIIHDKVYPIFNKLSNNKKEYIACVILHYVNKQWELRSMGHYNLAKAIDSIMSSNTYREPLISYDNFNSLAYISDKGARSYDSLKSNKEHIYKTLFNYPSLKIKLGDNVNYEQLKRINEINYKTN